MRWLLYVALAALPSFASAAAHDDLIIKKNSSVNEMLLEILLIDGFDEDADNASNAAQIGQEICSTYGGWSCYSVNSIAEGICRVADCGLFPPSSIAQAICRISKECGVFLSDSIAQAICSIGKNCGVFLSDSIGEAICKVGEGTNCYSVSSVREGLNRISKSDRYWYWDQFYDEYNNLVWRCRGSQTGKFAQSDKCSGQSKSDYRWPNK